MLLRFVRGSSPDPDGLRGAWDHLVERIAREPGWRGATAGIAPEGFFATISWTSGAEARSALEAANVEWIEIAAALDHMEVEDSESVDLLLDQGEDRGAFVQFIAGRALAVPEVRSINDAMERILRTHRPDLVGSVIAWLGEGRFVKVVHFTSESEARRGESKEFPGGLKALFADLMDIVDDLRFVDVTDPWLASPTRTSPPARATDGERAS